MNNYLVNSGKFYIAFLLWTCISFYICHRIVSYCSTLLCIKVFTAHPPILLWCVCICIYVYISISIYSYTSRERNQLLKCPEPLLFPWNDPWTHDSLEWRLHLLKGPSSLKKCSCVCGWVAFSVGLLPIESWKMRGLLSPWIISGPFQSKLVALSPNHLFVSCPWNFLRFTSSKIYIHNSFWRWHLSTLHVLGCWGESSCNS